MKKLLTLIALALSTTLSAADQLPAEVTAAAASTQQTKLTFSMIKPGAVEAHQIGAIVDQIERSGLKVAAIKMVRFTLPQAKSFYGEHEGKPFFNDVVQRMSSGPVVAMVIQGDNAVAKMRDVIGATNPEKAAPHTIRALFGKSVSENAIHASDSPASAAREIPFFFTTEEIYVR